MARYWVYLNSQVMGPYELEQLIRVPGFSRQTLVSMDDYSGTVGKWISPAEIPVLAGIFQKADELHDAPAPAPRPAVKPKPHTPARLTPVAPPVEESRGFGWSWLWVLLFSAVIAGGIFQWLRIQQREQRAEERKTCRALIETAPLPSSSQYSTLRQYLQTKQIASHWEYERSPDGLYRVSLSWPPESPNAELPVYAFEVNLQVQSVRGLNTAAKRLLSEGFQPPASKRAAAPAKPKKAPGESFPSAINDRRQAFEQGDFESVWDSFSRRRKAEMAQGGISGGSFVRMQKMTYVAGSGVQQTIVKTKSDSDTERLVLIRQSQPKHPDIYIKQRWIWEEETWRLDDEEKKVAGAAQATEPPASASPVNPPHPDGFAPSTPPAKAPSEAPALPGMSDGSR
jgi:hypothetical protein